MAHSAAMSHPARLIGRAVAVAALATIAGCSDDAGNSGERPADLGAGVTLTIPPSRLTPFCQAMIDLSDRLETDPAGDEGELILDTYLSILDEVPAEIEEDFLVVIARLQRGDLPDLATTSSTRPAGRGPSTTTTMPDGATTDATTGSTLPDAEYEGWTPDDDPAIRVNGYVDFVCRDNLNNPGPPASAPQPPELEDTVPEDTAVEGGAVDATVDTTS